VPAIKTEITELATGLGATGIPIDDAFVARPPVLQNVPDDVWARVSEAFSAGEETGLFESAFLNGEALLHALDGLRGRLPRVVEWKGPHRPPGDNVIPADLRIDHVYLVSCKYLSNIVHNPGPGRLFDRLLVGESRSGVDWFAEVALPEYQALYEAARMRLATDLPAEVTDLSRDEQRLLRDSLRDRDLPLEMHDPWAAFCAEVSEASARRWAANLTTAAARLRLFWRLVRVCDASYFVLGAAPHTTLRFRVMSAWDWMQAFELRGFEVAPSGVGQPQVSWAASIRHRDGGAEQLVVGHVEIRWSHGRFNGMPEAKVYLDTPHETVPGYITLS
jgi:hypothetical protein